MSLCTIYSQGNDLRAIGGLSCFTLSDGVEWFMTSVPRRRETWQSCAFNSDASQCSRGFWDSSREQPRHNAKTVLSSTQDVLGYILFQNKCKLSVIWSLELRDNWWSAAVRSPYLHIYHHDESAMSKSHLSKQLTTDILGVISHTIHQRSDQEFPLL